METKQQKDPSLAPRCHEWSHKRIISQGHACRNGISGAFREYEDRSFEIARLDTKTDCWTIHCFPPPRETKLRKM